MRKNVIMISAIKYNRTEAATKADAVIRSRKDKLINLKIAIDKAVDAANKAEEKVYLAEKELIKLSDEIATIKVAKGKNYKSTANYRDANARYIVANEDELAARQIATDKCKAVAEARANYRRAAKHLPKWKLQPVEFVGKCSGNFKFVSQ